MTDLERKIKSAFEAEQNSVAKAINLDDLPRNYEAITDAWLTQALCHDVQGAEVIAHRLDTADDGSNNRRRIFVEYNDVGRTAKLPASVFCKATHGLANRLMLGHTHGVVSEGTFYRSIRPLLTFETPICYHSNFSQETYNSIVVLEDISPRAVFCSHHTYIDKNTAKQKIDILVDLHSRFYGSPEIDGLLAPFPTWYGRFHSFLKFHLEASCRAGFDAAKVAIPPQLFVRRDEVWPATMAAVDLHKDLPLTLCHGDVHLKNWYITHEGKSGLSDWGSVVRGHWSRDLAYTLSSCLDVEDRRAWEMELIRYYVQGMELAGVKLGSWEHVMTCYRQSLLTALAWWTLCVCPAGGDFPFLHDEESVLALVGRMATAIDDHQALDACLNPVRDA